MEKLDKMSVRKVALLQSLGLVSYLALVSAVMFNAEKIFGKMNPYLAPVAFLTLFSASALICGTLTLAYPALTFWEKKDRKRAVSIIINEAFAILGIFVLFLLTHLLIN